MNRVKKPLILTLIMVSILTIALPAFAYIWVYVNVPAGETVNVRDYPEGNVVFKLPRGTLVDMQAYADPIWSKVVVPGHPGTYYIKSRYLTPEAPTADWTERYGNANLKYAPNSYNKYVVNLQKDLRSAGYTSITNADGYFGSITQTAVKRFQKNNGLVSDGIVGEKTKKALWDKLH